MHVKAVRSATADSPRKVARRQLLLALPLAGMLALCAPGLAWAAFTVQVSAALGVGTYQIPAPASAAGTLVCTTSQGQRGASIVFSSVASVSRATGYRATLTPPVGSPLQNDVGATGTFQIPMAITAGKGKYTFSVVAKVGSWVGAPLQQTVTC